jgi:hypothetical protein
MDIDIVLIINKKDALAAMALEQAGKIILLIRLKYTFFKKEFVLVVIHVVAQDDQRVVTAKVVVN